MGECWLLRASRTRPLRHEGLCLVTLSELASIITVVFPSKRTHDFGISLLHGTCSAHCVRFACARLAVSQDRDIVALHKRVDAVDHVVKDALLVHVLAKNAIKDKHLPRTGPVHGEARGRCDVTGWRAETLGDKLEARIAWLERRAYPDGHSDLRPSIIVRSPALSTMFAGANGEATAASVLMRGSYHGGEWPGHTNTRGGGGGAGHGEVCCGRLDGDGDAVWRRGEGARSRG
jgi:hypothetical protein